MKKRTNKNRKTPIEWVENNMDGCSIHDYSTEPAPWQQVMDRLEGRILCYGHLAARCRGGPKQYTKSQMETAKARAMQEARIIVWMHSDEGKQVSATAAMADEHFAEHRERYQSDI